MVDKSCKILTCKEEIKIYLGSLSDYMFKKYIERGLPARYEDRRWVAHVDNLDEFMKVYTRIALKKMPDEDDNCAVNSQSNNSVK